MLKKRQTCVPTHINSFPAVKLRPDVLLQHGDLFQSFTLEQICYVICYRRVDS